MSIFPTGEDWGGRARLYQVILLGAFVLAFVGFFIGTRQNEEVRPDERAHEEHDDARGAAHVRDAPEYEELWREAYDKNRGARRAIDDYRRGRGNDWRPASRARNENRAYDGAPPTVPHPVRSRTEQACPVCHMDGVRVGERTGPAMSHDFMANCLQCHSPSSQKRPFESEHPSTIASGNRFGGLEAREEGPRSYAGAPPRIPHRTRERSECGTCHGEFGRPGPMSHRTMTNCRQCHAASGGPPGRAPASVATGSRFRGLDGPSGGGERAWAGAPPQMPHQLHMRENCASCHGPGGEAEIETSHPWRQSCTQCHAPTGAFDFRPLDNLRPFSAPPGVGDGRTAVNSDSNR